MKRTRIPVLLAATITVAGCGGGGSTEAIPPAPTAAAVSGAGADTVATGRTVNSLAVAPASAPAPLPAVYAVDFLATAGKGYDMNAAGDVIGRAFVDSDCGPFCLPAEENTVWLKGKRLTLPSVPGYLASTQYPLFINAKGDIAGVIGNGMESYAALWSPSGASYAGRSLGAPAGTTNAMVQGFDDFGRIVGWATTGGAIPTVSLPYMWSEAGGMVDLTTLGYPDERPAAMSPGGNVVTTGSWYALGVPSSVQTLPPPPIGYVGIGTNGSSINENGDQAHFLVVTNSSNLVYPFRLSWSGKTGTWQQIGAGTGGLSRYGMGSIDAAQNVTFTALSTGYLAAGPTGIGQALARRVSPAYGGGAVVFAGAKNDSHEVLAQMVIGRSPRLVKLVPAAPCDANCIRSSLVLDGNLAGGPPSTCTSDGKTYNLAMATVTMTSETGAPLANVAVSGRFLDDYWANQPRSGTTDGAGKVSWTYKGVCGSGAIAFLVDKATLSTRTLDRTTGVLAGFVIPGTTPAPTNLAPVAKAVVTCVGSTCTFDGTGSTDDTAVVRYEWRDGAGTLLSTAALWSRDYTTAETQSIVLTVYDGAGLSGSQTVTFTPSVPVGTLKAPLASASVNCVSGGLCQFSSAGSSDPDGWIVAYRWTDNNGAELSTQSSFSITYKRGGKTTVTLTVTDNDGLTASDTVQVVIKK